MLLQYYLPNKFGTLSPITGVLHFILVFHCFSSTCFYIVKQDRKCYTKGVHGMTTTMVPPKGTVVILRELREKYEIKPATKVPVFKVDGNLQLRIFAIVTISYAWGILKGGKKSVLELLKENPAEDKKHKDFTCHCAGSTKNRHCCSR